VLAGTASPLRTSRRSRFCRTIRGSGPRCRRSGRHLGRCVYDTEAYPGRSMGMIVAEAAMLTITDAERIANEEARIPARRSDGSGAKPMRAYLSAFLIWIFAIPWTALRSSGCGAPDSAWEFTFDRFRHRAHGLRAVWSVMMIGLAMMSASVLAKRTAEKPYTYNRPVLVIVAGGNRKVTYTGTPDRRISRKGAPRWIGRPGLRESAWRDNDRRPPDQQRGFHRIRDVRSVERLLRDLARIRRSSTA